MGSRGWLDGTLPTATVEGLENRQAGPQGGQASDCLCRAMLLWFWKKGREILHVRCERWKALTVLWVHCTYLCVLEGKAPCGSHKEEGTVNRQIKQASSAFRECRAGRGRTHAPTGISETTQCSDHLRVPLPVPQSRALLTVGHFLLCDSAGLSLKPSIHRVSEN